MPWWLVLLGLGVAVLAGWLVLTWLLDEADSGDPQAALRIDAIRTGLTVVAGTGGAVALLLAARRQWINERAQRHEETVATHERVHRERAQVHLEAVDLATQQHQERQARAAEHDATERRVTELYTKAVDLLGSDRPAVRTGGLYALERLAQDHPGHRQTIVDVICAYLRMPAAIEDELERQVRVTAQRLLGRHLRATADAKFWPGIQLDLAGARLVGFDLAGCTVETADLTGASFAGPGTFAGAVVKQTLGMSRASFDSMATFDDMRVDGGASFADTRFEGLASFQSAQFAGETSFERAHFADAALFQRVTFEQPTVFDRARFGAVATFSRATFAAGIAIEHAVFAGTAHFRAARFAGIALLRWTVFEQDVTFESAVFEDSLNLGRAEFHGSARFEGARLRPPMLDQTRAAASGLHRWPAGCVANPIDEDWLLVVREA
jgi:uncharacterized protein YjbI with pentapeptide repeats